MLAKFVFALSSCFKSYSVDFLSGGVVYGVLEFVLLVLVLIFSFRSRLFLFFTAHEYFL